MKRHHDKRIPIIIAVVVLVAGIANYTYSQSPQRVTGYVTRVIDGDTVVIEGGERVRLLYIDTPEKGQPCYKEASNRLTELIDGKDIVLERVGENRDKYGRLLRYIFVNDTLVNMVLVREGWAHLYIYDKGPYHDQFIEAEQAAKAEEGCVWK